MLTSRRGKVSEFSSTSQAPSGPRRTKTSGTTGVTGSLPKARPGLGLRVADFRDHVGDVFGIHAAKLGQLRHVAAGQKIEPGHQRLHGRIQPVLGLELQAEAFGQVARAHADGIEALHHAQHRLDIFDSVPRRAASSVRSPRT